MRIIAIRHGQTNDNRKGAIYGQPDQGLSRIGKKQARRAALLLKDEAIDAIYSSDLERCIETTAILSGYHPGAACTLTPQLREINIGSMNRLPLRLRPRLLNRLIHLTLLLNLAAPGGESWRELKARLRDFLNDTYAAHPDGTVLVVTHNVTIRAMRSLLEPHGHRALIGQVVPNCAIVRLTMTSRLPS